MERPAHHQELARSTLTKRGGLVRIPRMAAPIALLKQVPLFRGLDERQLDTIARTMRDRRVRAGDAVVTEGQGGVGFFIVESGGAALSLKFEETLKIGPGDFFGEIALLDDGARSAT